MKAKESAEKAALRALPRIDALVGDASLEGLRRRLGAAAMTRLARVVVGRLREGVRAGAVAPSFEEAVAALRTAAEGALAARARWVINAAGVVLHTNLGRAPLHSSAVEALAGSAGRYTSVEIDLATGARGARGAFAEGGLASLAGAEAALVVNNNAAAVLLALGALCAGRRVVVSRGELVEIGGGFRIPEVLARSGAQMVEVGTTNRTRLADYERAFDEGGAAAVLRVHRGNFRLTGFVEEPEAGALAALAHARGAVLVHDLGGGAFFDLAPLGLVGEPTVQSCVAAGADVVCFSTDKVLGGPQGGVLVGKAAAIERARRDPLARAVRLGRLPLVALEATVALYLEGRAMEVPALAALHASAEVTRARAERWAEALRGRGVGVEVVALSVEVGGGAFADAALPSTGVALPGDAERVARALRGGEPAIIARIVDGRVVLDARTVLPGEDEALLAGVVAACAEA